MAILAFWCLHHCFDVKQYRYYWLMLFILTTINLFFIAPGRTGMLVYIILIPLVIFQRLPLKKSLPVGLVIAALLVLTFDASNNFSTRVSEAIHEIKSYHSSSSRTSLGMRFDWWQNSIDLIYEKPVFGHGTGSFQATQRALIKKQKTKTQPSDNPHNEYLLLGVQTGLLGMSVFIALLVSQFFYSFQLPPPKKYLLQGVVVAMASGCLMNSFLFDSHQGHFYAILSALLMTPVLKKQHTILQ
jgi:O-antigen ligase